MSNNDEKTFDSEFWGSVALAGALFFIVFFIILIATWGSYQKRTLRYDCINKCIATGQQAVGCSVACEGSYKPTYSETGVILTEEEIQKRNERYAATVAGAMRLGPESTFSDGKTTYTLHISALLLILLIFIGFGWRNYITYR